MKTLNLNTLNQFSGTTQYHPSSFGKLNLTDGIKYLCDNAECYWLIDIIESIQYTKLIKMAGFIVWRIEVNDDKSWELTAWDDTPNKSLILYSQEGEYTDFPLKEFEFYQIENVILLKSEY